ncbi:MAG: putative rane protein [Alphaproteobacteria bacterium]|jgi:putative membrane protein|nr:putative rane protein [Alphaproteobacteria bacterium]
MKSIILATALSALATTALAQTKPNNAAPATQSGAQQSGTQGQQAQITSPATQRFMQKTAITDLFEIQSGQLAQQKAQGDEYKQFGEMIFTDHTKTSQQLKGMAQNMPGAQMGELDAAHKQKLEKLQSLSGAKFDAEFKTEQVKGHQDAIKLFQDYAQKGDLPDLKKFAQDTLPTLQQHLQHAQSLPKESDAATVGSGSSKKKR